MKNQLRIVLTYSNVKAHSRPTISRFSSYYSCLYTRVVIDINIIKFETLPQSVPLHLINLFMSTSKLFQLCVIVVYFFYVAGFCEQFSLFNVLRSCTKKVLHFIINKILNLKLIITSTWLHFGQRCSIIKTVK